MSAGVIPRHSRDQRKHTLWTQTMTLEKGDVKPSCPDTTGGWTRLVTGRRHGRCLAVLVLTQRLQCLVCVLVSCCPRHDQVLPRVDC